MLKFLPPLNKFLTSLNHTRKFIFQAWERHLFLSRKVGAINFSLVSHIPKFLWIFFSNLFVVGFVGLVIIEYAAQNKIENLSEIHK